MGPGDPIGATASRRWLSVAVPLAVAALALASWATFRRDLPYLLLSGDEAEYAEMGRRLASGRGFTTGVIFPVEVSFGVGEDKPALLRPPGWPLALAAGFAAAGAEARSAHLVVLACYVAACVLAALAASRLAGPYAGLVAGCAAALASDVRFYAGLATTETLTAAGLAAWMLLFVSRAPPVALGAVCGLLYLTRYNAGIVLPLTLCFLFERGDRLRRPLACVAGFALVCAPWWIRNAALAGDPLFSIYNVTLRETPLPLPWNGGLLYQLEPSADSPGAIDPAQKIRLLLPLALTLWPVPAANLAAFAGLLLGAWKRERACLLLLATLLVSKLAVLPFAVRSRYEVPFIPIAIALGVAAWWRHAPRWRVPALAGVLAAPLLPTLPNPDLREALHRGVIESLREDARRGGPVQAEREALHAQRARCLEAHPLAIASNAPQVVWEAGTVAIYQPRSEEDFWRLVEAHPVRFALREAPEDGPARERFLREFAPRPDCGPEVYERRARADAG